MKVKAVSKFVRGSARKARIPADVIRGMNANEALNVLKYMPKKAAHDVRKVVASAMANAKNNNGLDTSNLYITEIRVDEAAKFKRFREDSKGGYKPYVRKNCHITVVLEEMGVQTKEEVKSKKESKSVTKKIEKAVKSKKAGVSIERAKVVKNKKVKKNVKVEKGVSKKNKENQKQH